MTSLLFVLLGGVPLLGQHLTAPVLPGEIAAPVLRTEGSQQNRFSAGLRISSQFDDNALSDNRNKQANLLTLVEPDIGWTLTGLRAKWMLDYRPGFSVGYPILVYNSRSQLLDTTLHIFLTRRLRARIHESFLQSKSVFDQLQQSELTPGSSILDRPNSSVLAATGETSEQAGGDVSYVLTPRSVIGASGAFYEVSYTSALSDQILGSATSISTHAFYSYRFTRHTSIGLDYNVQRLVSQQPYSRALVQSVLYTHILLLRPNTSISFFGGPQHSLTSGGAGFLPLLPRTLDSAKGNWSWAGGANYVWSGTRGTLTVEVARRISDGAGLQGIVQLSSASAALGRQLTRRMRANLMVADNHSRPLLPGSNALSYISLSCGFTRTLNRRASLELQYWRAHETSSDDKASNYFADHNRIAMTLVYDFTTPLHR